MTTPAERLAAAIHLESAAIAPQTSPLIEAAKEVLVENGRLKEVLKPFVDVLRCIAVLPANMERYGANHRR